MSKISDMAIGDKKDKEISEWKNKYLRALADYQNLEKRIRSTREVEARFAAQNFILKLLPVLDTLKKAEKSIQDEGIQLAIKQFEDSLAAEQVKKIDVSGKKFDPQIMECVEAVESDKEGEVVEEIRTGYMMWDKVIRAAQVKVGKKKIDRKAEEEAK